MNAQTEGWMRDADTLEAIFHAALEEGDVKGVEWALRLLAPVDPRRAVRLHDDLKFAMRLSDLLNGERA